jgi:hypothetical protein
MQYRTLISCHPDLSSRVARFKEDFVIVAEEKSKQTIQ